MLKLDDIKLEKFGKVLYVLPGRRTTECAREAAAVLDKINAMTAPAESVQKTKSGATITRRHSGNKRYFLGV